MFLTKTRCLIFVGILLVLFYNAGECKRGGGGRRGSVSRGSSVWGRSKQSSNHDLRNNQRKSKSQPAESESVKKPPETIDATKPSAPPSPSNSDVKKQTGSSLSENPSPPSQQRPIGWDVGEGTKTDPAGKNIGWNTGHNGNQSPTGGVGNAPPPYSSAGHAPPPYSGPNTHYGAGNQPFGGGMGNPPPPYSNVGHAPPPYPGPIQYGQGFQQPPMSSYPQTPGQYGNTGFMSQPGSHYPNMNGYGAAPFGGGFYGNNKYNKHGFGGYSGSHGFGGYGVGGYGKKFGGGFGMGFGKHAVRNVVMGLLVWHLVSGLTRRPYNVYNYYNNPEKVPGEIPLPANTIVLCPENVTSLCAPNTASLCTSTNSIMCVVLAQQTIPCDDNSTLKCVNSTATCGDEDNPCDDKNSKTTSVNIPCITNATITGKVKSNTIPGLSTGDTTDLCVTTLAVPQPEEEQSAGNHTICQPPTNANANSTVCNVTPQLNNATTPFSIEKTASQ